MRQTTKWVMSYQELFDLINKEYQMSTPITKLSVNWKKRELVLSSGIQQ